MTRTPDNSAALHSTGGGRQVLLLGWGALTAYWVVAVHRVGGLWSALPEYSYGWVVPLLCAMLFVERWRSRPARSGVMSATKEGVLPNFAVVAMLLAAFGFALARMAVEVMPTWRFSVWVFIISVETVSFLWFWLVGGVAWVRHFFFPLFFFLLSVPWPDRIETPFIQGLTQLNASVTVELLALLNIAAVRMGNIILIELGMVGVQEACSGIRSFQSTLMVALFLGELFHFSFWRRIVFVLLGALLSFAFNIIRTSFLVWTCNKDGLQAVDRFHDPAGWTILAASGAGLSLIGWWLYRQHAKSKQVTITRSPSPSSDGGKANLASSSAVNSLRFAVVMLLMALIGTELGIHWWFKRHEKTHFGSPDWRAAFEANGGNLKKLQISKEVQALLNYDRGGGWEWQGGGGERWQAFFFTWDEPKTLARRIVCTSQATGHQPEVCFTLAGMELSRFYGRRQYLANGVPLVFKVFEFLDRNRPIYVFACTWERDEAQTTAVAPRIEGQPSTMRGIRESAARFARGDRGVVSEVRVLKFGIWGPRSIAEAEAAFQQQLNQLIFPTSSSTSKSPSSS